MIQSILFISSSKELQNYANIYLNHGLNNFTFTIANSISETVQFLNDNDYNLIFLGHHIIKDKTLKELSSSLLPVINSKKSIIFGTNKALKDKSWATYFHEFTPKNKIFVNIFESLSLKKSNSQYISMPLLSIINFEFFPFDCFVKIQKSEESEYIKIFKTGDEVLFEDIYKYKEKGVGAFYVDTEIINQKINELSQTSSLEEIKITKDNAEEVHECSIDYVSDVLNNCGIKISENNKKLSQKSFNITKKIVKESIKNKNQLSELFDKEDLFYYKHITMTSVICCFILDKLHMNDESLKSKLCIAASLHNILLEDTDELKVDSKAQLDRFSTKRKKIISEHPSMAAIFFESNEKINSDVIKILREHHGDSLGKQFMDSISSNSKLSVIFQMATQFAQQYLVESEFRNNLNVDVMKIFLKIHGNIKRVDRSLVNALRDVALSLDNVSNS